MRGRGSTPHTVGQPGATGGGGTNARNMPPVSGKGGTKFSGTMGSGEVRPQAVGCMGSGIEGCPKPRGVM